MNKSKATLLGVLLFAIPSWSQIAGPPRAGSINYVEGQASIGATTLAPGSVGSVVLERDQTLTTQAGKVEVLLTPGVFVRVAENSAVKMISPDLANTRIQLEKGRALVEVIHIRNENHIHVDQNGASTKLLKNGLYDFDEDHAQVRVFKGKAELTIGSQKVTLKGEHQATLNTGAKLNAQGFESRAFQDEFYRWNGLRSGYLSEASVDAARIYIGPGPGFYGPGWMGFGWYWNPWFSAYTFLPEDNVYWGPFGWGFYSPFAVYRSPFFFYRSYPHGFGNYHYPYGHGYPRPGRPLRPGSPGRPGRR